MPRWRWRAAHGLTRAGPSLQESDTAPAAGERQYTLLEARIGTPVEVFELLDEAGVGRRLRPMGLGRGDRLRVVRRSSWGGPIVIEIPGRTIAIGRGVARKIIVRAVPTPSDHEPQPLEPDTDRRQGAV